MCNSDAVCVYIYVTIHVTNDLVNFIVRYVIVNVIYGTWAFFNFIDKDIKYKIFISLQEQILHMMRRLLKSTIKSCKPSKSRVILC